MGLNMDEEILQDFLIEAGEILESLSEQLVDLEKEPENTELLNAIFRGFHTVKGGAGFLALTELVATCHGAENVFDALRNGSRRLTPEVMDTMLQALDTINEQFAAVQARATLPAASQQLLELLHKYSQPEDQALPATSTISPAPPQAASAEPNSSIDDISDDEFERLLDDLHGAKTPAALDAKASVPALSEHDSITDEEFDALLDSLHGKKNAAPSNNETPDFANERAQHADNTPEQVAPDLPSKPEDKKSPPPLSQPEQTVRVNTATLDVIMNMVGELVLVRNRLLSLGAISGDENIMKAVSHLDVVTGDLQGAVMQTRMQPIHKVFGRFPRVVRDLARSLKKEIVLQTRGEETGLDKNLVEALADPMVHLVRNSVDHGIEMPEEREQAGKPRVGTITLAASQVGDHILLLIEDDGRGMDPDKLRTIAVSRGLMDADTAARLTENEAFNLIFMPGFSTKTEISDISGRGVGMDVVKTAITKLNGTITIDSHLGAGTIISIKVPLTLAILPTLMVGVNGYPFAFPLSNINEIIKLDSKKTNVVDGQLTILVRNKAIPLFYLQDWLCRDKSAVNKEKGHVVILQLSHQSIGFVVDSLIGQEEVVIKALDKMLHGTPGIAGATITSDGQIALILDVANLLKHYVVHKS